MNNQLLETLFEIAGSHATDEQLNELAEDADMALHAATVDIATLSGLLVKNKGSDIMEYHLVENISNGCQKLLLLKNQIESVQDQRKEVNVR